MLLPEGTLYLHLVVDSGMSKKLRTSLQDKKLQGRPGHNRAADVARVAKTIRDSALAPTAGTERNIKNKRHILFLDHYFSKNNWLNAQGAAIAAGYAPKTAGGAAHEVLKRPEVRAEVQRRLAVHRRKLQFGPEEALAELAQIVRADVNEIIRNVTSACRYCHGVEHGYQWRSRAEFDVAHEKWILEELDGVRNGSKFLPVEPSMVGGFGFSSDLDPNIDCPVCGGEGETRTVFADTTKLSPAAKRLYAGIKVTRDGPQPVMHDQLKAMELIGRHLGLFKDVIEIKEVDVDAIRGLSDEELDERARDLGIED